MQTRVAAARWAETWQRAWPAGDAAAIEVLYALDASYRSSALAEPTPGGVTAYLARQFATEQDVRCRFGKPVADGSRAAVEWWASWVEDAQTVTLDRRHCPAVRRRRASCRPRGLLAVGPRPPRALSRLGQPARARERSRSNPSRLTCIRPLHDPISDEIAPTCGSSAARTSAEVRRAPVQGGTCGFRPTRSR